MINNVVLVGRMTRDAELRYTPSNQAVATFSLAVNRNFKSQNGEREADFINCVIWRQQAENLANWAKKGALIGITGRIQTRNYENQQGQRVYVTEVRLGDRSYRGVTNVGVKPTIEGKNPVGVETHLLDFAGDLYGKVVTVEFLTRIREERKFSSIEALKEEMQNNIAYARAWFEKNES